MLTFVFGRRGHAGERNEEEQEVGTAPEHLEELVLCNRKQKVFQSTIVNMERREEIHTEKESKSKLSSKLSDQSFIV